jgi:hypothetical protein
MFSIYCPRHGREVLLSTRNIEALERTPLGVRVMWRCTCDTRGTKLIGRRGARDTAGSQFPLRAA